MTETTEERTEVMSDEEILVPHEEVTLSSGRRLIVAPWGMTQKTLVWRRLASIRHLLRPGEDGVIDPETEQINPELLLERAWDECVELVSMTVDIPREEMERPVLEGGWTFEDMVNSLSAVLNVCVLRSDGTGVLPSIVGLVARSATVLMRTQQFDVAGLPSLASVMGAISTGTSGNGSASPRKKAGRRGRKARH